MDAVQTPAFPAARQRHKLIGKLLALAKGGITISTGEKLKELRTRMKKTLKEQSKTFGVSINSIYRWEHDLVLPRKSTLVKIANYYGVSLDQLLLGEETIMQEDIILNSEILPSESHIEQLLLSMFRKLSTRSQYRIIGYIERICIEDFGE